MTTRIFEEIAGLVNSDINMFFVNHKRGVEGELRGVQHAFLGVD